MSDFSRQKVVDLAASYETLEEHLSDCYVNLDDAMELWKDRKGLAKVRRLVQPTLSILEKAMQQSNRVARALFDVADTIPETDDEQGG